MPAPWPAGMPDAHDRSRSPRRTGRPRGYQRAAQETPPGTSTVAMTQADALASRFVDIDLGARPSRPCANATGMGRSSTYRGFPGIKPVARGIRRLQVHGRVRQAGRHDPLPIRGKRPGRERLGSTRLAISGVAHRERPSARRGAASGGERDGPATGRHRSAARSRFHRRSPPAMGKLIVGSRSTNSAHRAVIHHDIARGIGLDG